MKKQAKNAPTTPQDKTEPQYSFDEAYKAVTYLLVHGTKEQQDKLWKRLNEGEGDWAWLKAAILTECINAADAKGKEKFCLINIKKHLKSGYIKQIEDFTDEETGIKYRQYKRPHNLIWRIPYATDNMDKCVYEKALNKKFLGDYIELKTAGSDEVTLIPLDTPEKVNDINNGGFYYQNHPLFKDSKIYKLVIDSSKSNIEETTTP